MKAAGYFWCDECNERADGARCEHQHAARFVHVALTAPRANEVDRPQSGKVEPERASQLFAQIHQNLNSTP